MAIALRARAELIVGLTATLVVGGCGGGSGGSASTETQQCGCTFLYATTNSGRIFEFPVNAPASLVIPGPVAGPASSAGIAVVGVPNQPYVAYLYASDPGANSIRVYSVRSTDGALSPAAVGPYPIGNASGSPGAIVDYGSFLYVATSAGDIVAFNVNADGSLSSIPGSPFAAGSGVSHLLAKGSFSVSNTNFLYAANTDATDGSISAFTIATNGSLEPVPGSPFPTAANAGPAGFYDGGKFLYVALKNANAVAAFSIGDDGSLTPLAGAPFPAGRGAFSLEGADGFLYAVNNADGTVSSYSMDPFTGSLTAIAGSPFPGSVASGDALRVSGTIYLPNAALNRISALGLDSTGGIQPLTASGFQTDTAPVALVTVFFPGSNP